MKSVNQRSYVSPIALMLAAFIIIFLQLSHTQLWTEESCWAAIISEMLLRHDYFHPYIAGTPYYDKPLLSYWLSILWIPFTGGFNTLALRLPSAIAGLICVYSLYRIGTLLVNPKTGLLAGWMLISSYFFIFWSRVAGVEILNIAGILLAIDWYYSHRNSITLTHYAIFFIIIALTCLCKGLLGFVITGLVLIPDLLRENHWKKHLNKQFIFAFFLGVVIYLTPFLISHYTAISYQDNGLFKVYRENIVRFFHPFDHRDPFYTYFIYLPAYLLPWTPFFLITLYITFKNWHALPINIKNISWATLLLFLFFTLSGSRRSYYILPVIPFAILMTAYWLNQFYHNTFPRWLKIYIASSFIILLTWFGIIQQFANRHDRGIWQFAEQVKATATQIKPWPAWQVKIVDGHLLGIFYLQPQKLVTGIVLKDLQTSQFYKSNPDTLIILKKSYFNQLKNIPARYKVIIEKNNQWPDNKEDNTNGLVALIPK